MAVKTRAPMVGGAGTTTGEEFVKPRPPARLTEADQRIWSAIRARWPHGHSSYMEGMFGDRRDAALMYQRELEKQRAQPFERWEHHRRQWWPLSWGVQ